MSTVYVHIAREVTSIFQALRELLTAGDVRCFCYGIGNKNAAFFQWLIPQSLQTQICIDHTYANKISIPALTTKTKSFVHNS
jgi:hypothetical protein